MKKNFALIILPLLMAMGVLRSGLDKDNFSGNGYVDQLDQEIPGWMERDKVPGLAIAVIEDGKVSWSKAYGMADLEKQTPMTIETVCRVESISKSVTARGVMKHVEEGHFALDDPLIKHISSWQFPPSDYAIQNITIRQLLSHSSGLALGTLGLEYAPNADKPSLRESLSGEVRVIHEPGRKFNYSNVGYHLLELLIEDVTGKAFSEYMHEEILDPLGMNNSGFEWSKDFITAVPNGYEQNGKPVPVYVYSEKGAGGLFANVDDVASFVITGMTNAFYSPENILSEKSMKELYEPEIETAGVYSLVSESYGLGHFIETLPGGQKAVFGGGQGHGWMTHFHMVPAAGVSIVILTNSSRSWPLISQILDTWAEGTGIGAVGMGLITKAIKGLWVLNIMIFLLCLILTVQILNDLQKGRRNYNFSFRNFKPVDYLNLGLFLLMISLIVWVQAQDYLFLTSVFPGVGEITLMLLWMIAFVLILSIIFKKTKPDLNVRPVN